MNPLFTEHPVFIVVFVYLWVMGGHATVNSLAMAIAPQPITRRWQVIMYATWPLMDFISMCAIAYTWLRSLGQVHE